MKLNVLSIVGLLAAMIGCSCAQSCGVDNTGKCGNTYNIRCFSADTIVQVLDKGSVAMKDLSVGDKVVTASKAHETVYAFGHWNPVQKGEFIKISTFPQESHAIELSPDHLLKVNGRFVKASSVKAGDSLQGNHNTPLVVKKVESIVRDDGVYAPLTPSGTIMVDGVLASSYISLQNKGNEYPVFANGVDVPISQQFGSHMYMAPFRLLCIGVSSSFCGIRNEEGVAVWVDLGMRLASFANEQNLVIQIILMILALVSVPPFYAVEYLIGAKYAPLVFVALIFAGVKAKKMRNGFVFSTKKEKAL